MQAGREMFFIALMVVLGCVSIGLVVREVHLYRSPDRQTTRSQLFFRVVVGVMLTMFVMLVGIGRYRFSPDDGMHTVRNLNFWAYCMAFGSLISLVAMADFVLVMLQRRQHRDQLNRQREALNADLKRLLAEEGLLAPEAPLAEPEKVAENEPS